MGETSQEPQTNDTGILPHAMIILSQKYKTNGLQCIKFQLQMQPKSCTGSTIISLVFVHLHFYFCVVEARSQHWMPPSVTL